MPQATILSLSALAALVPAALLALRRPARRDFLFWTLLAVALVGPLLWVYVRFGTGWHTGLSSALFLTIVVCLALFAALAAVSRHAWRLSPLLMPYLIVLAAAAVVWQHQPEQPLLGEAPAGWIRLHIALSLATYGLVTLGAVAGLAVFLQERALKAKRPTGLTRSLPSMADAERLEVRLLAAAAGVLGLGLLTGMATQYYESGAILTLAHKTLLSILTFVVIVALLLVHRRTGLRGRRAARLVLLAWLLLTLAYPGVKFVTDVLLA